MNNKIECATCDALRACLFAEREDHEAAMEVLKGKLAHEREKVRALRAALVAAGAPTVAGGKAKSTA
jgi:hypothetical protein